MSPKSQSAAQPIRRKFSVPLWVWSLALLAGAFFALYMVRSAQGAPGPTVNANPPAWMVQAQPSNLNAPRSAEPALNPAVQSILGYIAAHEAQSAAAAPEAPRAIDPAVQSVLDYVSARGLQYASEAPEVVMDADALSYTDYLRRHGLIPDAGVSNTPMDPAVQSLMEDYLLHLADAAPQSEILADPYGREMEIFIAEHGLSAAVGAPDLARDAFAKNLTEYLRLRTQNRFNASPVVDVPPDEWWLHQGEEPAP